MKSSGPLEAGVVVDRVGGVDRAHQLQVHPVDPAAVRADEVVDRLAIEQRLHA